MIDAKRSAKFYCGCSQDPKRLTSLMTSSVASGCNSPPYNSFHLLDQPLNKLYRNRAKIIWRKTARYATLFWRLRATVWEQKAVVLQT